MVDGRPQRTILVINYTAYIRRITRTIATKHRLQIIILRTAATIIVNKKHKKDIVPGGASSWKARLHKGRVQPGQQGPPYCLLDSMHSVTPGNILKRKLIHQYTIITVSKA